MRARPLTTLAATALLAAAALSSAPAATPPPRQRDEGPVKIELKEWTLDNGLRVLFAPHRRIPVVSVQLWYHAGSKDEHPGIRGIAHLFEHMMFKGSEHVPPERHAKLISAIGGSTNAFTSDDVTAYHNTVPSQYMEFAMKLEAERLQNLRFTPYTIKSERQVVKEEKRMRMENSPIGRALEALRDLSYVEHPYSWTPAGDMQDLSKITLEDCRRFYGTYYVPNNATLIVVGDVTEARVRAAAKEHFGAIPRAAEPPPVTAKEPEQEQYRELVADWPSQLKVVLGGYHVPAASHPDMPALKVLSAILSAGRSSRLNQALVRKKKIAVAAGGFANPMEQPGLFILYGVGLPTHDVSAMKQALLEEVSRVAQRGVTEGELAKARNQLATAALSAIRTASGIAYQIGHSAHIDGDPRAFITEVMRLDRVTDADVKRVAREYLVQTNLSMVILNQTGANGGKAGDK